MFQDGSEVPTTYSQQRCEPCQLRHSLYEPTLLPTGTEARNKGLAEQATNFTLGLSPVPVVRCVNGRRNAASENLI